jgi:hypothetical protein
VKSLQENKRKMADFMGDLERQRSRETDLNISLRSQVEFLLHSLDAIERGEKLDLTTTSKISSIRNEMQGGGPSSYVVPTVSGGYANLQSALSSTVSELPILADDPQACCMQRKFRLPSSIPSPHTVGESETSETQLEKMLQFQAGSLAEKLHSESPALGTTPLISQPSWHRSNPVVASHPIIKSSADPSTGSTTNPFMN